MAASATARLWLRCSGNPDQSGSLNPGGKGRMDDDSHHAASLVLQPFSPGLLSFAVMAHGVFSAVVIDSRFNPVLSVLYCVLPILSFPLFLLGLLFRKLIPLQGILALAWLPVYSALNWRACASHGYCTSVAATVWMTLRTQAVMEFLGVVLCSTASLILERSPTTRADAGK